MRQRLMRRLAFSVIVLLFVFFWQGSIRKPTGPAKGTALETAGITPATAPAHPLLHIATFNIDGGVSPIDRKLNLSRTASALKGLDLVALEEVHGGGLLDHRDQAAILGQSLGMSYLFAPAETRWFRSSFGNGILTNLDVKSWRRDPLSTSTSPTNRALLRVNTSWQGQNISLFISHLDRQTDRDIELGAVIAAFQNSTGPAILLGDLNTRSDDQQLAGLRAQPGVVDCITVGAGHLPDDSNVDWIFARQLRCVAAGLRDNDASDHRLAWADLVVEP